MAQVVRKQPDHWHHRDLRRALMNAALAAIEKGGVEAVNTRSLAKRAGVSPSAPYHHFENRHGLLVALAFEGFEELLEALARSAQAADGSPVRRLEALGRAYVRFAQEHPGHFRVMFLDVVKRAGDQALDRVAARTLKVLEEAVLACQNAGEAPRGDPRPLVLTAWTAVHGCAALWTDGSLREKPGMTAEYCERVVAHTVAQLVFAARGEQLDDDTNSSA